MKLSLQNITTTFVALTLCGLQQHAAALEFGLSAVGGLSLTDNATGISDIQTIFAEEYVKVKVTGVEWKHLSGNGTTSSDQLRYETLVDGTVLAEGDVDLSDIESALDLPATIDAGDLKVSDSGRHEIVVNLFVGETEASAGDEYEAFKPGVAIIPLLIVFFLAMTTQMVELSLFSAIFVGACMVTGNIRDGFKTTLDDYILNALANIGHGYVYLFTLFLSGMVGMMEKSGGMLGFTKAIAKYAKTPTAGQFAAFAIGISIFFDDYANTLLAGQTMKPLTDILFISREKLSFVVDATAAPIASLTPISSWVGFEVGLIQTEIDRLVNLVGADNITIETSGLAVFLQTIKYRFYPIFMLIFMPLMIYTQRDFGPMLVAERRTQVYHRTDGGEGKGKESEDGGGSQENQPRPDTPLKSWNMAVPIALLVFFIFWLLVKTGEDGSGTQSFLDKIEGSDSYAALLWGTMAATALTLILYLVQIVQHGELVLPTWDVIKAFFSKEDNEEEVAEEGSSKPRALMSVFESVEAFLFGMGRIFPALIVLTLAWASGAIMIAVGADRLFSRWITEGVSPESLPTLSFVISGFMALATGTSWGTMTILFPLLCVPTYQATNGDETLFYATVAGILSGSVAGDHMSPISDTSVLSALACDCDLLAHVSTQAPYAFTISLLSILFGTLPIGRDAWPNIVGILLGAVAIVVVVYAVGVPIMSPIGRYDPFTWAWLRIKGSNTSLDELQDDTVRSAENRLEGVNDSEGEEASTTEKNNRLDSISSPEEQSESPEEQNENEVSA